MFLEYYGLKEQPFGVTPDPKFLYLSESHREALIALWYGIQTGRGFMALLAEPGLGKTSLLFRLREVCAKSARTLLLVQNRYDSCEFLRHLLTGLGIDPGDKNVIQMSAKLNQALTKQNRSGKRLVLLLDEAQNLEEPVLETVRLISNFETAQTKLIHIILSGHAELAPKLERPALRQRLSIVCNLRPFTPEEVGRYIDHRMHIAGYKGESLFTADAKQALAAQTSGIPRILNNVCFHALTLGFTLSRRTIDTETVEEALSQVQLEHSASEYQEEFQRVQNSSVAKATTASAATSSPPRFDSDSFLRPQYTAPLILPVKPEPPAWAAFEPVGRCQGPEPTGRPQAASSTHAESAHPRSRAWYWGQLASWALLFFVLSIAFAGAYDFLWPNRGRTHEPTTQVVTAPLTSKTKHTHTGRQLSRKSPNQKSTGFSDLRVSSNVAGAQIFLDGRTDPAWVTPYTFRRLPGHTYVVAVSKDGYRTASRSVDVSGLEASYNAQLTLATTE
jgi:general secretion pathway protein A